MRHCASCRVGESRVPLCLLSVLCCAKRELHFDMASVVSTAYTGIVVAGNSARRAHICYFPPSSPATPLP